MSFISARYTLSLFCDRYDIMNYQKYRSSGDANYSYKYTRIGGWIDGNLTINDSMLFWPNPGAQFNAPPVQSFCSEPCPRGYVKVCNNFGMIFLPISCCSFLSVAPRTWCPQCPDTYTCGIHCYMDFPDSRSRLT